MAGRACCGPISIAIMIVSGDYIEMSIGVTLGISTLTAAALGNVIADVLGLNLGGLIEELSYKLGVPEPKLSRPQMDMGITRAVAVRAACLPASPCSWSRPQPPASQPARQADRQPASSLHTVLACVSWCVLSSWAALWASRSGAWWACCRWPSWRSSAARTAARTERPLPRQCSALWPHAWRTCCTARGRCVDPAWSTHLS